MTKRINRDASGCAGKAYLNRKNLAAFLDVGVSTAEKIGKAAGAKIKFGKNTVYSVEKVNYYMMQHIESASNEAAAVVNE